MNDLPYRNTLKEPFAGESGRCSADERHYLLTDGSAGLLRCNIYDVSHNRALVQEWAIVFCVINKVVTMVGAEAVCRGWGGRGGGDPGQSKYRNLRRAHAWYDQAQLHTLCLNALDKVNY